MKKIFLASVMVCLAIAMILFSGVAAAASGSLNVTVNKIEANGIDITDGSNIVGIESGSDIPLDVSFKANEYAEEVEISAWLQGERSDSVEINFADLIEGKNYNTGLEVEAPEKVDPQEDLTLYLRIETNQGNWEESYQISIQREPYNAEVLFVELENNVEIGSRVPVNVVIQNSGRHELEDVVVSLDMPGLGISKRAFFGDLTPVEDWEDDDDEDTREKRVYLNIPANVASGVYELTVKVRGDDFEDTVVRNIAVTGIEEESRVIVPIANKEFKVGEVETYDLILINTGTRVGVYEFIPQTSDDLIVEVEEPITTIAGRSSKVVEVKVEALDDGEYSFGVNVNSQDVEIENAILGASVSGKAMGNSVTVLTVVLAIIFVVLLVVLIVLLTRKPKQQEELEESYY